jgi:hypothetical protein
MQSKTDALTGAGARVFRRIDDLVQCMTDDLTGA